jgi:hypothetical protein
MGVLTIYKVPTSISNVTLLCILGHIKHFLTKITNKFFEKNRGTFL